MTVKIQGTARSAAIIADGTVNGTVKGYMGNPHVNRRQTARKTTWPAPWERRALSP